MDEDLFNLDSSEGFSVLSDIDYAKLDVEDSDYDSKMKSNISNFKNGILEAPLAHELMALDGIKGGTSTEGELY